ncbi:MAG: putative nucleotidyltransferase substrate binding domain-containing protein, partial [Actinomycetes bacterium]
QATVRSIHERLYFRPLLEAFSVDLPAMGSVGTGTGSGASLSREAIGDRLAAFGFSDAARTRTAVVELTRGLSRSSRLWQQLLPLVLEWLSQSPDPELGLLGLRSLADSHHARGLLTSVFRESAETARQLCCLLGTGPGFGRGLRRQPELLRTIAGDHHLDPATTDSDRRPQRSLTWRSDRRSVQDGLIAWRRAAELEIAARDVLDEADVETTGHELSGLAEAVVTAALEAVEPEVALAVIAMGRLGGRELSYASDLDVLLVFDPGAAGPTAAAGRQAEEAAANLLQLVNGATPATRVYALDTSLRPEGRQGPVVRSLDAYATYYGRWAETWERQALLRGRWIAGDTALAARFAAVAERFVWDRPLTEDDERAIRRTKARIERERIPAGEDPQFHLKLGRGSLSDVEWTVQLLQLRHRVRGTGTLEALDALTKAGVLDPGDARILVEAYRFCERTRNRLYLVRGSTGDALPSAGAALTTLARSFGTTGTELREEYRRRTRRSRRVAERVFYGME